MVGMLLRFESEMSAEAYVLNTWCPAGEVLGHPRDLGRGDLDGESRLLEAGPQECIILATSCHSLLPVPHEVNSRSHHTHQPS